jgi:hypothetical protein
VDNEKDIIASIKAKNSDTTVTTIKTDIKAFLTCSFVGKITLFNSSFALLYTLSNLFIIFPL